MPDTIIPSQGFRDGLRYAAKSAVEKARKMQGGEIPPEEGVSALMKLADEMVELANA